jgi:CheY-like chemotaxis protein
MAKNPGHSLHGTPADLRDPSVVDDEGCLTTSQTRATEALNGSDEHWLRVLVADDDDVNRETVVALLRERGWQVIAVADGNQALEALEAARFDVVLMDLQMPVLNGVDATRLLRRRGANGNRRIPIIAMTSSTMPGERERCLEAGMDDFLAKPAAPGTLYAAVERWGAEESQTEPQPADLSSLLSSLKGNKALVRKLAGTFLRQYPAQLEALREAVGRSDPKTVEAVAHRVRGSLNLFRAPEAAKLALDLETRGHEARLAGSSEVLHGLEQELGQLAALLSEL